MVNSVFFILFAMAIRGTAALCGLVWRLVKAALWLAVVPAWDAAVLTITGLMWLAGGLVGAELPRLQVGRFGLMAIQWEDLYARQWQSSCR